MKFREDFNVIVEVLDLLAKEELVDEFMKISEKTLSPILLVKLLSKHKLLKKIVEITSGVKADKVSIIQAVKMIAFYIKIWKESKKVLDNELKDVLD